MYILGLLLLLLCQSTEPIQLPTVSLPIDLNSKQLPHLFYVSQKISTTHNVLDIINTLNLIPASYRHNILSEIQIKAIYQLALTRTIILNPNLLLHIYSIILLHKIPNTIDQNAIHIVDIATNYSTSMDYASFYLLSEKALLWALSSDVTLRHRPQVSMIYQRMQFHMFNATEMGLLNWTNELKQLHLELLIVLYSQEPALLLSSFQMMIQLNIITLWTDFNNDSNRTRIEINLSQFQPIHLMWILRYIIHEAVHMTTLEYIDIYCTQKQRKLILDDALKDLITDHGNSDWLIVSMKDILPQLRYLTCIWILKR